VIEGDIKGCFDEIPHKIILKCLKKRIGCRWTLDLITRSLKAGVVKFDTKQLYKSSKGTPQGSIMSPILANIVLHELDVYFVNKLLVTYTYGAQRAPNKEYRSIVRSSKIDLKEKLKMRLGLISKVKNDPLFRRIKFVRYADDWVILFAGPFSEALIIKEKISRKLQSLGLKLNDEKTNIRSINNKGVKFLGSYFYIRKVTSSNVLPQVIVKRNGINIKQRVSSRLILLAPVKELVEELVTNKFVRRNKFAKIYPCRKTNLIPMDHATIIQYYNSLVRGILNYYTFALNRYSLHGVIQLLQESCAITLASKYKIKGRTKKAAFSRFGRELKDPLTGKELYRPSKLI
jgi:hypothetical protein